MVGTLSHPPYWLLFSAGWPDDAADHDLAECAAAVAPGFIPRRLLTGPAAFICDLAHSVARERHEQVVLFSDLTGEVRDSGGTWPTVGVPDWEAALDDLQDNAPALVFTLSRYAHLLLCTAGNQKTTVYSPSNPSGHCVTVGELADLRAHLHHALQRDWPHYINDLHRAGTLRRE